jgi:hypothetical protein
MRKAGVVIALVAKISARDAIRGGDSPSESYALCNFRAATSGCSISGKGKKGIAELSLARTQQGRFLGRSGLSACLLQIDFTSMLPQCSVIASK